jgi:hypothetical protein
MPPVSKQIYQVRYVVSQDVAVVTQVREDGSHGEPKEVRSPKLILGGVDSYWLASSPAEKTAKIAPRRLEKPVGLPNLQAASAISLFKGNSGFNLPLDFESAAGTGKFDAVTFSSITRLTAGFSPSNLSKKQIIEHLRVGDLVAPGTVIEAIEVNPEVWIRTGFTRFGNQRYGFAHGTRTRSVGIVRLANRPDTMRLPSGLVLFLDAPRWGPTTTADLRPEEEILRSADAWIARIASAVTEAPPDRTEEAANIVRSWIASSISLDEKADLESAFSLLSVRQNLLSLVPQFMAADKEWQKRLREVGAAEEAQVRETIENSMRAETEQLASEIERLRAAADEARDGLEKLVLRETLLRDATREHDARLREMIADAARSVGQDAISATKRVEDDVAALRDEISRIEQIHSQPPAQQSPENPPQEQLLNEAPQAVDSVDVLITIAPATKRRAIIEQVASASCLRAEELMASLAIAPDAIPVLVGSSAATVATDLAFGIGGERSGVVFCDPTHVTLADLLREDFSGFGEALKSARQTPDLIVPVALCGITRAPCEFWLPQLVEMRRVGRLPRNLLFIATAGTDGMRIDIPNSVLRYLFPLEIGNTASAAEIVFEGAWPLFEADGAKTRSALAAARDALPNGDNDLRLKMASILERVPEWTPAPASAIAGVLKREADWISAWRDRKDHQIIKHLQGIGG